MKTSIFMNNICYGIDYTARPDCIAVIDITDEEYNQIQAGTHEIQEIEGVRQVVHIPQQSI